MEVTPSDVLRKASERTRHKWHQGGYYPQDQLHMKGAERMADCAVRLDLPGCAVGNLWWAEKMLLNAPGLADESMAALVDVIDAETIIDWNDTPGRTADEVADAMLAAADKLDGITDPAAP